MRTITKNAVKNFRNGKNFKCSNTQVENDGNRIFFYLHGNCIACLDIANKKLKIATAGWKTNTTKERLNGILKEFNLGTIFQKNWSRYYQDNNGKIESFNRVLEFSL